MPSMSLSILFIRCTNLWIHFSMLVMFTNYQKQPVNNKLIHSNTLINTVLLDLNETSSEL